ncbi:MFS transporter [Nocardia miyunensis]|uniref:MFS transporter n=1 Tax=Nocardia miyunensis TaxID=282684 RepID=UPI00082E53DB|nr:MFS transporter [Nocardia miyunensis]
MSTTPTVRPATAEAPARRRDSGGGTARHHNKWLILIVLAVAQLMVVLDSTIVNIALPEAQRALGFNNDLRQWIVTAYSLTFGGLLLAGGRLNDLFGRKRTLIIGLIGFAASSALGGWSPNFEVLVTARALQGVFGALLAPAALSLLTVTFAEGKDRARAFGIYGAISGAGAAIGLLVGGVLTEYLSWNWCLYVNVAFAVIALVGAARFIPGHRRDAQGPTFDLLGASFVTVGLFALVYGLANSESKGWSDTWTLAFIGVGIALLAAFVLVESRVEHPLLPLRVLLDRVRGTSYLVMLISAIGMFGVFMFLTYYLQNTLGYSPVVTGLAFLPMVGALAGTASLAGGFTRRVSPKLVVGAGLAAAGVGMVILTRIEAGSGYATGVLPGLLVVGIGLGAVFATAMGYATTDVATSDAGVASAMVNTAQQVGGSIGISLLSSFSATAATNYVADHKTSGATMTALQQGAQIASYHTAFWWAAGFFFAGAVLAGLLYPAKAPDLDPDAAPVIAH